MDSKALGMLIYEKVFNVMHQPLYPCNIELGNVIIDSIKASPIHGVTFHTTRNHSIPLSHLDKNQNYFNKIYNFINSI